MADLAAADDADVMAAWAGLGYYARARNLLACARAQLPVAEYAARFVKKAVTGVGNGSKDQVRFMIERLLPGVKVAGPDAADALAVAITHAHHKPR